jgi:hypothetical protein
VSCDLVIDDDSTLIVGLGTRIDIDPDVTLTVRGGLVASGGTRIVGGTVIVDDPSDPVELAGVTLAHSTLVIDGDVGAVDLTVLDAPGHGIHVTSGSIGLEGLDVARSGLDGLYCDGYRCLDGDGEPDRLVDNAGHGVSIDAPRVGELWTATSYAGNGAGMVEVRPGAVTQPATWGLVGGAYHVTGEVTVDGDGVLTLGDGVVLAFTPATGMTVGWDSAFGAAADLVVDGHTEGVRMTSDQPVPMPGDWRGLAVLGSPTATPIVGLTVEYAGSDGVAGVDAQGSWDAYRVFERSTFRHNLGSGVHSFGHVSYRDCVFADNEVHGLDASDWWYAWIDEPFVGNTLTGNGSYPIKLLATEVGDLDPSSTFRGNGLDYVAVVLADVAMDARWQKLDVPYALLHDVTFGQSGAGASLTLDDGVIVELADGADLRIGDSITARGNLHVDGHTEGVVVRPHLGATQPGGISWVYGGSGTNLVEGLTQIGGTGLGAGRIPITVRDSTFIGQELAAISSASFGLLRLEDVRIEDCGRTGLLAFDATAAIEVDGLTVTGCGEYPVQIRADLVPALGGDLQLTGNAYDYLAVITGPTLLEDATWHDVGVPYLLLTYLYVDGPEAPVLTITAPEVQLNAQAGVTVGHQHGGDLVADGVRFRPAASWGDRAWTTLWFGGATSTRSSLAGATVEGGGTGLGMVVCEDCALDLDGATVRGSASYGLYYTPWAPNGQVSTVGTVFEGNASGATN